MPENKPLVSVIFPFFQVEDYIGKSLESILSQTLKNIEIICVNDGSTDGGRGTVAEYANTDHRIQIIDQENRGISEARNAGIRAASGKYLYFMDSDDILELNALELLKDIMDEKQLDYICFNAEAFGEDEGCIVRAKKINKEYFNRDLEEQTVFSGKELFFSLKDSNQFVTTVWTSMIRRTFLLDHNLWFCPGIYHEDEPWTFAVLMKAKRAGCLNRTLYHYRIRQGSITGISSTFRHSYGLFLGMLEVEKTIRETEDGNNIDNRLIKHVIKLQKNAAQRYNACSIEEKERLLSFPLKDRIEYEKDICCPASIYDEWAADRQRLLSQIHNLKSSASFRIGRAVTWVPRKAWNLIKRKT